MLLLLLLLDEATSALDAESEHLVGATVFEAYTPAICMLAVKRVCCVE
jgi:ABC-type multidrug transport system fused ATPase/permease subunit